MAHDLKRIGFMDISIYPTSFSFIVILPAPYRNSALRFVLDSNVLSLTLIFECKSRYSEDGDDFDFVLFTIMYTAIV